MPDSKAASDVKAMHEDRGYAVRKLWEDMDVPERMAFLAYLKTRGVRIGDDDIYMKAM